MSDVRKNSGLLGVPNGTSAEDVAQRKMKVESILRQTLMPGDDSELESFQHTALNQIAKRHPGAELSYEPIMIEITAALLSAAFLVRVEQSPMCMDMVRSVARTMWDDMVVRERLGSMWSDVMERAG